MLPVLLIGVAAAALLAGCSRPEEKPSEQKNDPSAPPANSGESTGASDSAPPAPQTPITLDFDQKLKAFDVYQKLKEAGVQDEEFDHGYAEVDYSQPGPNETIVGKGDRKIQEREVLTFLADHHEKYGKILEGLTGAPDPLALDDQDPKTDFDDKIRQKLSEATLEIKAALKAQGLDENSPEFKEKMGVALFHFVHFPEKKDVIKKKEKELRENTGELAEIGLSSFRERLFQMGGFGVSEFKTDSLKEGSALSALQKKKGGLTEKAKILYAVFSSAGLSPRFVRTRLSDMENALDAKKFKLHWQNRSDYNLMVSIPLGDKSRTFDPNLFNSKADYPNPYPLSLAHFYAGEMNQQGFDLTNAGKLEAGLNVFFTASRLDPGFPFIHNSIGQSYLLTGMALTQQAFILSQQGKEEKDEKKVKAAEGAQKAAEKNLTMAVAAFAEAAKRDPHLALGPMSLGGLYLSVGKGPEAAEAFKKALKIDPKNALAHNNLSTALMMQGKKEEALKYAQEAVRLDSSNAMFRFNLGKIYSEMEKSEEAIAAYKKTIRLEPKLLDAYQKLYDELKRAGKFSEALEVMDQAEKQAKKMAPKK